MTEEREIIFENPQRVIVSSDFIAGWSVILLGNEHDLQDLHILFRSAEMSITEKKGIYYLKSVDFDQLADEFAVHSHAIELLQRMIGIARVCLGSFGGFDPVRVSTVSYGNEDGTIRNFGFGTGTRVNARRQAVAGNGDSWAKIAGQNDEVDEALHYFSYELPNWFDLFRVYEVIRDDVGGKKNSHGEQQIKSFGWVDETELNRFKATVQTQRHRYAERHERAYANPMSLLEAESLIRELLDRWLRSKSVV